MDYERECIERNKTHELLQQKENGNLYVLCNDKPGKQDTRKTCLCNKNQIFV